MSTGVHHHFVRVQIDGFRGHHLDVSLGDGVTVLTGPNRAGKTTTADALSLAVSGGLPGAPTDKDGLAETDVLAECTPASEAFAVEATDEEGQWVRFRFSQGEKRGWRDVSSSLVDSKKNDEHLAAIAARYGTGGRVLGPVAFDPAKLRTLDGGAFEREILRLCGDSAGDWTVSRIIHALADRAWSELASSQREILGEVTTSWLTTEGEGATEEGLVSAEAFAKRVSAWPVTLDHGDDELVRTTLGALDDPRVVLVQLSDIVTARLKEARSDVIQRGKELLLPLPDAPEGCEIEELELDRDAARGALSRAQEEHGRLRGRAEHVAEQRAAEKKRLTDAVEAARRDLTQREEALAGLRRSAEQDENRAAMLAVKITAIEQELSVAQSKFDASTRALGSIQEPTDEQLQQAEPVKAAERAVATARTRLAEATAAAEQARAEETAATPLPEDLEVREQKVASDIQATDAAGLELTEQLGTLKAERQMHVEKAERHAAGNCPECGQPTKELHAALDDLVAELDERIAQVSSDIGEKREHAGKLRETRKAYQTMREEHRVAVEAHKETTRKAERTQQAAAQAVKDAERELKSAIERERRAAAERRAGVEQRVATAQAEVIRLTASIDQHREEREALVGRQSSHGDLVAPTEQAVADARARLVEAERTQQAAAAAPTSDPEADAELLTAAQTVEKARIVLAGADETYSDAKGRLDARSEVQRRRDAAARLRDEARAYSALWKAAQAKLYGLEREVLQSYVAPLVEPVNALLRAAGVLESYGRLEASFGRRFQLGFRNEDGFAPLSQTSAGHFAMAATLIVAVSHRLTGSAYRAVQIDNAEAVDRETRESFLGMLAWLCAQCACQPPSIR